MNCVNYIFHTVYANIFNRTLSIYAKYGNTVDFLKHQGSEMESEQNGHHFVRILFQMVLDKMVYILSTIQNKYGRICLLARHIYEKRICILKYDVFMENVFSYFWKIVC